MALNRDNLIATLPARVSMAVALRDEHADAYRDIPARARYEAQEKATYIMEVDRKVDELGCSQKEAAKLVTSSLAAATRWPLLAPKGRLNYENSLKWRKSLGKRAGKVIYGNWRALIAGYSRGERGRKGAEDWWQLFYSTHFTGNAQHLTQAYRDTCRFWVSQGMPEEDIPTRAHVRYWNQKYGDRYADMLTRNGKTWFHNHVMGYVPRDWSDVPVGEISIGDHRKTDNFIRVWDKGSDKCIPQRIWVTAWRDARSGHFTGYLLYPGGDSPNADTIIQCLTLAIQDCGLPAALYIDNGKDFCAQGFTDPVVIEGEERSICLALGIEVIHAIAFNPQAKPIENSFKTLVPYFDKRMPGYVGNSPANRPEDAWKWAKEHVGELPNLQQATELFGLAVEEHERRVTESTIQDGIRTVELWKNRKQLRPAIAAEDLHMKTLRPTKDSRQIRRGPDGPSVRWGNWYYSSPPLVEYGKRHWGEDMYIYIDAFASSVRRQRWDVPSHIYAASPDGRLMRCEAAGTVAAWARTDEDRQQLKEAMADKRRLLPDTKKTFRNITKREKPADSPLTALADKARELGIMPPRVPEPLPPGPASHPSGTKHPPQIAGPASLSARERRIGAEIDRMLLGDEQLEEKTDVNEEIWSAMMEEPTDGTEENTGW